jgi:hypothetical protein
MRAAKCDTKMRGMMYIHMATIFFLAVIALGVLLMSETGKAILELVIYISFWGSVFLLGLGMFVIMILVAIGVIHPFR